MSATTLGVQALSEVVVCRCSGQSVGEEEGLVVLFFASLIVVADVCGNSLAGSRGARATN